MCKFILLDTCNNRSLHYTNKVQRCFNRYAKYLQDDFSHGEKDIISYISNIPFFYIILSYDNEFMGFVYLDNFVGDDKNNYSAELTTCFEPHAWGTFTRYSAKFFLKKAFDEFGLYKIKAYVFPDNYRTSVLLKSSGFEYETTLKKETVRKNKLQDIDIYAIYRTYYYKNEVKYEQY
ncbi:GNAT family N-acetyltransferase [bacterium]|nr:GNAT family N-acetyltransferase [bacterium]